MLINSGWWFDRARTHAVVTLACAAALHTTAWSAFSLNETFRNSTAPNWLFLGSATLTSGAADTIGAGWLRLNTTSFSAVGSAIYNTPFSSSDGLQATFTYATYGGTGADGFAFYLIDGSTASPTVGAKGSGLGYSREAAINGVTNGYLGIGFDEWGNFGTAFAGTCIQVACNPTAVHDTVAIRGSGNLLVGFDLYSKQTIASVAALRTQNRKVRITLTPAPTVAVTVELDSGSGFVKLVDSLVISSMAGQAAMPATFKLGFSGSAGALNNFHEIRDLVIGGGNTSTTTLTINGDPACGPVQLTAAVSPPAAGGSVEFYDGTTLLGTRALSSGSASLSTDLSAGAHTLSAKYLGDSSYAISASGNITKDVATVCPSPVGIPTLTEWGMAALSLILAVAAFLGFNRKRVN